MAALKVPKRLERMAAEVAHPEHGFFGPESVFWRVSRERALLLGGASAALLQLAHPAVAAGVAQYSNFDTDPVGRFHRTFQIVYRITFGNVSEAIRAAAVAWHIHSQISGVIEEDAGASRAGDRYTANRPDLLLWVHATLVQQALEVYQTFIAPLSEEEKVAYYRDSVLFAKLFGIPEKVIPPDLPSFYAYFDGVVERELGVSETGMRLRRTLLTGLPQYWVIAPLNYVMAGAFLPPKTREQYHIPWNRAMEHAFHGVRATLRRTLPYYPERIRYEAMYREALRRIGGGVRRAA
jgi:uncharacterized protein (DUF2236 family)